MMGFPGMSLKVYWPMVHSALMEVMANEEVHGMTVTVGPEGITWDIPDYGIFQINESTTVDDVQELIESMQECLYGE